MQIRLRSGYAWLGAAVLLSGFPATVPASTVSALAFASLAYGPRDQQDWTVLEQGDFSPVALASANELDRYGFRSGVVLNLYITYEVFWLDVTCSRRVTPGLSLFGTSNYNETFAKAETPGGEYVLLPILQRGDEPGSYAIPIPIAYAPKVSTLKLTLSSSGCKNTVLRLNRIPKSIEQTPQKAKPVTELRADGISVSGRAFPVTSDATGSEVGLGYRLSWSELSSGLFWRIRVDHPTKPFVSPAMLSYDGNASFIVEPSAGHTTRGAMMSIPFSRDVNMLGVKGVFEGYAEETETVDFGTLPLLRTEEEEHEQRVRDIVGIRVRKYSYLDISEPIARTLPSGLRITLLPLRSPREHNLSHTNDMIYVRIQADADSLRRAIGKAPMSGEEPIVEVRRETNDFSFHQIQPPRDGMNKASPMIVLPLDSADQQSVSLRLKVRKLSLQKRLSYSLLLPVDRSRPEKAVWSLPLPGSMSGAVD
ncbi:MAG: hypothetical protein KF784_13080 [Fimbriimonadaceae bacterium]|nr:hypothetical protein [Fimbriimonadaceae bacterium]